MLGAEQEGKYEPNDIHSWARGGRVRGVICPSTRILSGQRGADVARASGGKSLCQRGTIYGLVERVIMGQRQTPRLGAGGVYAGSVHRTRVRLGLSR